MTLYLNRPSAFLTRSRSRAEKQYHRAADYFDSHTLQPFTLFIRAGILILILLRLFRWQELYPPAYASYWILALGSFALYILFLLVLYLLRPSFYISPLVQTAQVLVDIIFFGTFLFLTQDLESDLVFAFLLPLLIAARYFTPLSAVGIYLVVLIVMGLTLWLITQIGPILPSYHSLPQIFLLRAALFGMVMISLMRVTSLNRRIDLQAQQSRRRIGILTALGRDLLRPDDLETLLGTATANVCKELQAESAALFIYDHGRFRRRKISPQSDDWFTDESYALGEGVTGQAALPGDGTTFGQIKRVNNAGSHPQILHDNLLRYMDKLQTGHVAHVMPAPLNGSNQTFGILRVVNKVTARGTLDPDGFTQDDEDLLTSISAMVSLAYSSARGIQKLRAVLHFDDSPGSFESEEIISQKIAQAITGIGYDACAVNTYRLDGSLTLSAAHGFGAESEPHSNSLPPRLPPPDGDRATAPSPCLDLQLHPDPRLAAWSRQNNWSSLLQLPLVFEDRSLGSLDVFTRTPFVFYHDEETTLELFASQASIAVTKARLAQDLRDQQQRMKELAALMTSLMQAQSQEQLFDLAAHKVAALLRAEDCTLFWVDRASNQLQMKASHALPAFLFDQKLSPISASSHVGLPTYVAATGEALLFVGDTFKQHPAWQGKFFDHLAYLPSRQSHSLMLYPIIDEKRNVIGVIKAENKIGALQHVGFQPLDAEMMEMIAAQIGTTARKIQHLQNLRNLNTIAADIIQAGERRPTLERIAKTAFDVLPADLVLISPFDSTKQAFQLDERVTYGNRTDPLTTSKPRKLGLTNSILHSPSGYLTIEDFSTFPVSRSHFATVEDVQSAIAVALRYRDEPLGVIFFDYRTPRRFLPEEIEYALAFANLASIAIYNSGLYATLAALPRLTKGALQHQTLDDLIQFVLTEIVDHLGFELAIISLVNPARQTIESRAGKGLGVHPEWIRMSSHSLASNDIQACVVNQGETIITSGWDERFDREIFDKFGHQYLIRAFVPIRGHSGIIGTVEAGFDVRRHPVITKTEKTSLEAYVDQIGLVIQSVQSLEQSRQSAAQLKNLLQFSQQLTQLVTQEQMPKILTMAADLAAMATTPDAHAVIHYRQNDDLIPFPSSKEVADLARLPFFHAPEYQDIFSGATDVYYGPTGDFPGWICYRLSHRDETLGSLCVLHDHPYTPPEEEQSMLALCATQASLAINLAKSHQQLTSNLAFKSYEIYNFFHLPPGETVRSIRNLAENLCSGVYETNASARKRAAHTIFTLCDDLIQQMVRWRNVQQVQDGFALKSEILEPDFGIADTISNLEPLQRILQVHVTRDLGALQTPLWADPAWLLRVWKELIHNAIKFNRPGGSLHITGQEDDQTIRISFADTGRGIRPDALARIFDRFHQEPPLLSNELEGSGLGLYLVREVVNKHGGEILVQSELALGSTFTVVLSKHTF